MAGGSRAGACSGLVPSTGHSPALRPRRRVLWSWNVLQLLGGRLRAQHLRPGAGAGHLRAFHRMPAGMPPKARPPCMSSASSAHSTPLPPAPAQHKLDCAQDTSVLRPMQCGFGFNDCAASASGRFVVRGSCLPVPRLPRLHAHPACHLVWMPAAWLADPTGAQGLRGRGPWRAACMWCSCVTHQVPTAPHAPPSPHPGCSACWAPTSSR